jgi:hypothetical protein
MGGSLPVLSGFAMLAGLPMLARFAVLSGFSVGRA